MGRPASTVLQTCAAAKEAAAAIDKENDMWSPQGKMPAGQHYSGVSTARYVADLL